MPRSGSRCRRCSTPNLPLDLIEALDLWAPNGSSATTSCRCCPWWLVEIAYRLFGVDAGLLCAGAARRGVAFAADRMTARRWWAGRPLVAILIIDGLHLFPVHRRQVQSRRDPAAVMGACRLCLPCRPAARTPAALDSARARARGRAMGKYFVAVLAVPLALFMLIDPRCPPQLATPGPWIALAPRAPRHGAASLVWLVERFPAVSPMRTCARAGARPLDHIVHPLAFAGRPAVFLAPALAIAAAWLWPDRARASRPPAPTPSIAASSRYSAFGPAATVIAPRP